jgi:hypothetical protein
MANTTELLRIMRHAADRLRQEDAGAMVEDAASSYSARIDKARKRATSASIAMAYAVAVLELVAAAMDDEPRPQLLPPDDPPV